MRSYKKILPLFAIGLIFITGCKDDDPKPFKPVVALQINHEWNDSLLVLNKPYYWEHDSRIDTIIPKNLIYHMNHLTLLTQDSLRIDADLPYYMIDYTDKAVLPSAISFKAPLEGVKYYITSLIFTIGVADSLTNEEGLLTSTFISPMYWAMIAGYINFRFDANSPQSGHKSKTLAYHIGGYKTPYYNSRRVRVNFDKPYLLDESNSITISANIFKLLKSKNEIDIRTINQVELPIPESILLADNMKEMFSFDVFE